MRNPFNLYKDAKNKDNCTKSIFNEWDIFVKKIHNLQIKYASAGANDTSSREEMANWISINSNDIM